VEKLVACPKCGRTLPARKLLFLSNLNAITCPVCSSKLRVKNKDVNSVIGGVGGGLGGGLGTLLLIMWVQSGNMAYVGLIILLIVAVFLSAWLLEIRYLKLKAEETSVQSM
jgi:ATP/ADP translocase